MNNKNSRVDNKSFYLFVVCITLSIDIIGATFAFFTASANDNEIVKGESASTNFSLFVSKVTSLDLTFGLIPMKNTEAPYAAENMCYDDLGSVGCQIYKITLTSDDSEAMFVDGYITTTPIEGIETRLTRVYPKDITVTDDETGEEKVIHTFGTSYTKEEMADISFNMDDNIKSGKVGSDGLSSLNREDDYDALFVSNEQIGGDAGNSVDFYVMIWIWDDGTNQDFVQGQQIVYTGMATFISAYGNEIKASFD